MTLCEVQLIYSTVCFSSFDTRLFFFFVCVCVRVCVIIGLWVFCPSPSGKTLFFSFLLLSSCCLSFCWLSSFCKPFKPLPYLGTVFNEDMYTFFLFFFFCVYRLVSISNAIGFCFFFSYCYLLLCCHVYLQSKPRQTCMRVELWIKKKKREVELCNFINQMG